MAIANLCIEAELGAVENPPAPRGRAVDVSSKALTKASYTLGSVVEGLLEDPLVADRSALSSADALSFSCDINYHIKKLGLRWPDVRYSLQNWGHGVVLEAMRQMASAGYRPRRPGPYLIAVCRRIAQEV